MKQLDWENLGLIFLWHFEAKKRGFLSKTRSNSWSIITYLKNYCKLSASGWMSGLGMRLQIYRSLYLWVRAPLGKLFLIFQMFHFSKNARSRQDNSQLQWKSQNLTVCPVEAIAMTKSTPNMQTEIHSMTARTIQTRIAVLLRALAPYTRSPLIKAPTTPPMILVRRSPFSSVPKQFSRLRTTKIMPKTKAILTLVAQHILKNRNKKANSFIWTDVHCVVYSSAVLYSLLQKHLLKT